MRADLSGIAKGYAVDQAARALDGIGIADYLVEAGGEIRTRGHNADGRPWQIAIERPDAVPQRAHRIVPLTGLAMATSGDYRIYFERDGERYCHEIDPATGRPIRNGLASVTVVRRGLRATRTRWPRRSSYSVPSTAMRLPWRTTSRLYSSSAKATANFASSARQRLRRLAVTSPEDDGVRR